MTRCRDRRRSFPLRIPCGPGSPVHQRTLLRGFTLLLLSLEFFKESLNLLLLCLDPLLGEALINFVDKHFNVLTVQLLILSCHHSYQLLHVLHEFFILLLDAMLWHIVFLYCGH